ncbi:unnamed protein product, partial [Polarella glacialis]
TVSSTFVSSRSQASGSLATSASSRNGSGTTVPLERLIEVSVTDCVVLVVVIGVVVVLVVL